jgi:hypothetical protein
MMYLQSCAISTVVDCVATNRLGYSEPIGIVQEGQGSSICQGHGIKLSARPVHGRCIAPIQRVARQIVGDRSAVVRGQLVFPVGISIAVVDPRLQRSGSTCRVGAVPKRIYFKFN